MSFHICLLNSLEYFHRPILTRTIHLHTSAIRKVRRWIYFRVVVSRILFLQFLAVLFDFFSFFSFFLQLLSMPHHFLFFLLLITLLLTVKMLFFYLLECHISFKFQLNTSSSKMSFWLPHPKVIRSSFVAFHTEVISVQYILHTKL